MHYIYILRSKKNRRKIYVGVTGNIQRRLIEHNLGMEKHTKVYAPWEIESHIAIKNKTKAFELEKYLKSGSGNAFLKKRLLMQK